MKTVMLIVVMVMAVGCQAYQDFYHRNFEDKPLPQCPLVDKPTIECVRPGCSGKVGEKPGVNCLQCFQQDENGQNVLDSKGRQIPIPCS